MIGGTKAMHEVTRKEKLRRLLNELKTRGQLIVKDRALVDAKEKELENRIKEIIGESPQECDDLHIFALSKVSGCLLVISRDNRMAICRAKIRNNVGHEYCPSIKVIQNQNVYNTMKQ